MLLEHSFHDFAWASTEIWTSKAICKQIWDVMKRIHIQHSKTQQLLVKLCSFIVSHGMVEETGLLPTSIAIGVVGWGFGDNCEGRPRWGGCADEGQMKTEKEIETPILGLDMFPIWVITFGQKQLPRIWLNQLLPKYRMGAQTAWQSSNVNLPTSDTLRVLE